VITFDTFKLPNLTADFRVEYSYRYPYPPVLVSVVRVGSDVDIEDELTDDERRALKDEIVRRETE
jgi:hypothetical protein